MVPADDRGVIRTIVAVSLFVALVAAVLAAYVVAFGVIHPHLRSLEPALDGLTRLPRVLRIGPDELVLGTSVLVMIVALITLFVRDARHSTSR